jgi:lysophospholipase L1-like esterase
MSPRKFRFPAIVIIVSLCSFILGSVSTITHRFPTDQMLALVDYFTAPAGESTAPDASGERSSYWRERTSFFRAFPSPGAVAMIGDSLTDGAEWHEMFPATDISNRGIDSDTTDGVLARLDDILLARPEAAFIMIGINDFADADRSVEAVFDNFRAIVSRLDQRGIRVIVQSTLPCNEAKGAWKSCASINGRIRQLNLRLATLASERVRFVDLTPALAGEGGLKDEFTYDGVHLNGEGYLQWRTAIAPFMPAGGKRLHPSK